MNGAQDMGGQHGFGPVLAEPDEPPFHAEWERRAFALTVAMGACGEWNLDQSRYARESLPPAEYLRKSYYEIWLAGLERLLAARGLVQPEELEAGKAIGAPRRLERRMQAADVEQTLGRGGPVSRPPARAARFAVGDRVRARNMHPTGHTRLPRYVRGHVGVIERVHGCHVFPDTNARGEGEDPQWLYAVRFAGHELWGPDGDPAALISVDAFEPYLEPA